jgi:Kelch motif
MTGGSGVPSRIAPTSCHSLAPVPGPRDHTAAVAVAGLISVAGGRMDTFDFNTGMHVVYDPQADRWEERAPMPTPRSGHGGVFYRGKFFCIGGEGTRRVFGQVEAYDVPADSWQAYVPMPTLRHGMGAAVVGDAIHVVGGGPMKRRRVPNLSARSIWALIVSVPLGRLRVTRLPPQPMKLWGSGGKGEESRWRKKRSGYSILGWDAPGRFGVLSTCYVVPCHLHRAADRDAGISAWHLHKTRSVSGAGFRLFVLQRRLCGRACSSIGIGQGLRARVRPEDHRASLQFADRCASVCAMAQLKR